MALLAQAGACCWGVAALTCWTLHERSNKADLCYESYCQNSVQLQAAVSFLIHPAPQQSSQSKDQEPWLLSLFYDISNVNNVNRRLCCNAVDYREACMPRSCDSPAALTLSLPAQPSTTCSCGATTLLQHSELSPHAQLGKCSCYRCLSVHGNLIRTSLSW